MRPEMDDLEKSVNRVPDIIMAISQSRLLMGRDHGRFDRPARALRNGRYLVRPAHPPRLTAPAVVSQ